MLRLQAAEPVMMKKTATNMLLESTSIIFIKSPNQAIASTPPAPRPTGRQKEGAPLNYICKYHAHPKLAQDTRKCS
jgi:hypothetical protein